MARAPVPTLDRPWHRPGRFGYVLIRLRGIARPPIAITEPPDDAHLLGPEIG